MLKSEIIKILNSIEGDYEVVFPNVEYGGYEIVNKINIKKAFHITEEGMRKCPETGTDYLDKNDEDTERLNELYEKQERTIIVLSCS